jgi:mono/diheme cytochrome c family protein
MTAAPFRLVATLGLLALPGAARAQRASPAPAPDSSRSTRAGVYSPAQAARGSDIYALSCANCHQPVTHTGPGFVAKWDRRPLLDLFEFIRATMPKNEPGTLSRREYIQVLAYLLKMNGMPAGPQELPADSAALRKIRIEFAATGDPSLKR